MIGPTGTVRVLVATTPVDFRKGAEGLAALVRETMKVDPFSGAVYVFRAKRADRVKLIYWDGSGVCLFAKRLEDGKFHRFESMFTVEEGKLGVLVTFLAMLELAKEQLLDIVQEAPLAPIYIKSLALNNTNEPLQFSSEFDDTDAANDTP